MAALDGLRGLTAIGIVVLHVWMFDYGDAGRPEKTFLDHAIGELRLGVPLFFLLSGFLLFRPFVKAASSRSPAPALGRYALHRAARILPGYWLALATAFVLLGALDHPRRVGVEELPMFLLFLQNFEPSLLMKLDPPMWTLCVEVTFYAVLPIVGALAVRFAATRARQALLCIALLAIGIAFTTVSVLDDWPATLTNSLLTHLHEFAAGMLVAVLVLGRRPSARTGAAMALAGTALVLANAWWHGYGVGPMLPRELVGDVPAVAGFALIVAAFASAPLKGRVLCSAPVRMSGTLSYGIYLLHYLAIDLLRARGEWPEHLGAALVSVLTLTVAAAAVSWYLVEQPVLRFVRARARQASRPDAARALRPARPVPSAASD